MSDVLEVRKQAKAAGINGKDLLAAKREVEAYHREHMEFVHSVRREAFRVMTGRTDKFWLIFGHYSDPTYGRVFHGGGDYTTIKNWDTIARTVFYSIPGLCADEYEASEALWNFLRYEPFRIPCNADLYKEAAKRLVDSVEMIA